MEDAVVSGGFLQGQREKIGAEEVLPEIIICGGIGEVYIRPDDEAFASGVGGTLEPLEKLEAENSWGFYLGVEGVDQTDVGIDGGVAVGGGGRDN